MRILRPTYGTHMGGTWVLEEHFENTLANILKTSLETSKRNKTLKNLPSTPPPQSVFKHDKVLVHDRGRLTT